MTSRNPLKSGLQAQTTTTAASDEPENRTLLERTINFLGDEDIHREYHFLPHLNRIDEYLRQLFLDYIGPRATKKPDFDVGVWEQATLMVKTHKEWIAKDETVRPVDFDVVKALLEERAQILKSGAIRQPTGQTIIPAPVMLPNIAIPKEIPLSLALPPDDPARKKLTDPLHYTKKAAQHRRLKEYAATHVEDQSITSHIPTRPNFHGPHVKEVSKEEAEKATADRILCINALIEKLGAAQAWTPRPLLKKVIARIAQGRQRLEFDSILFAGEDIEDFNQWTTSAEAVSPLTDEEFKLLSILTEGSWDSTGRPFTDRLVVKDKHPEDRFHVVEVPNLGISRTVRYNSRGDMGPQITMDSWAVFQRLGYRLGVERIRLHILSQDKTGASQAGELAREAKLKYLITNQFPSLSIDSIIRPLLPPGQITTTWTPAQKTSILRSKIIQESLQANSDRTLDHKKLWQFAAHKEEPKRALFSVSRWPIEVKTREQRRDMERGAAPIRDMKPADEVQLTPEEEAALEREEAAAYFAPPPRERFVRGYPHYPFGETRVQEMVLSASIANDLAGVEGYDFCPVVKPSFWSGLNPVNWWRKRKAEDDGNEESGKRRDVGDDSDDSEDSDDSDIEML